MASLRVVGEKRACATPGSHVASPTAAALPVALLPRAVHSQQQQQQQQQQQGKAECAQSLAQGGARLASEWDGRVASSEWPQYGPLAEVFNVHKAIRSDLYMFRADVQALTCAVSEQKLDELRLRLDFFRTMLTDHCLAEDAYILPALQLKVKKPAATALPSGMKGVLLGTLVDKWEREHENVSELHALLVAGLEKMKTRPLIHEYEEDGVGASARRYDALSGQAHEQQEEKGQREPLEHAQARRTPYEQDRSQLLKEVKRLTDMFCEAIKTHMDDEELVLLPVMKDLFTHSEQGELLVAVLAAAVSAPVLPWTLRVLSYEERLRFLGEIERYASDKQLGEVAGTIISALPASEWSAICSKLPKMKQAASTSGAVNPLVEITSIHAAIRGELKDLETLCEYTTSWDMDDYEVRYILARLTFLQHVLEGHSAGEDAYIIPQLQSRSGHSEQTKEGAHDANSMLKGEHEEECQQIQKLIDASAEYLRIPKESTDERASKRAMFVASFRAVKAEMFEHMRDEEDRLLPMVRQHFSLQAQDNMVRNAFTKMSLDIFPWLIEPLSTKQRIDLLRNILRSAPDTVFKDVSLVLARAVQKGVIRRLEWDELVLRIPELHSYSKRELQEETKLHETGPVSEIYRVHKAIRIELSCLHEQINELIGTDSDEEREESDMPIPIPHPNKIAQLSNRFRFLSRMVDQHSRAEDLIVLPALNARQPGVADRYHEEHCGERYLFATVIESLDRLQCVGEPDECIRLLRSVHILLRVLRADMLAHLDEEEKQLWPLLIELFTPDEQTEVVGRIFGQIPEERLREMLPWMIQTLSAEEQQSMMSHLLSVTRSTMFEKWLLAWFPNVQSILPVRQEKKEAKTTQASPLESSEEQTLLNRFFTQGKEDMQRAIRAIANDDSLSADMKSRLMQNLMLSSWRHAKIDVPDGKAHFAASGENDGARSAGSREGAIVSGSDAPASAADVQLSTRASGWAASPKMLAPSYADATAKVLGCQHYRRDCKVVSACCNKIYPCRLCHDAHEAHAIDRYETVKMVCMHCHEVQSAARTCRNPACGKTMGKYFCKVCRLWDNDESRSIYHCHMCNVCRVGKGLGIDNVHCMKCNACIRAQHFATHKCIERVMESNCPICHEHMFMSTRHIKYLRCGHVMHFECFEKYRKTSLKCPYCQKSLADMSEYFERLDRLLARQPMPEQYRAATCTLHCNDCGEECETRFHFLFNKCALCASYNTTTLRIDPNGGDPGTQAVTQLKKRPR
ncbi:Zinc finger protein BRUTUS [Porphyridium purpureum]|uniref:Zinc finger protein BRUTUS n=1 Tax=Porphyridium purpureum TaxID=35688 RepID=A0A5J4YL63_PORPP|nr:Zinc finger protein BRUTUS [Porphyridium purpureum]|eukprot:POR2885..scf246_12